MEASLDQAIIIHAKVLRVRHKDKAPDKARDQAMFLKRNGDHEGHAVWLQVAEVVLRSLAVPSRLPDLNLNAGMSRLLLKSDQRTSLVERLCCPRGISKS